MQEATTQSTSEYSQNVKDMGYAIGTGVFIIVLFSVLLIASMRWITGFITNTIMNKLKENGERIDKLVSTKDEAMKGASDREAHIIAVINDTHEKTTTELARHGEKITSLLTAMNILIGKRFNGGDKDAP